MFAPAEQFAEMLESNADIDISGPATLISRDNAGKEQNTLNCEISCSDSI